jgi:polycomb protein EED
VINQISQFLNWKPKKNPQRSDFGESKMAKIALGCEPVVGSLTPSKKREYRLTNRLQEGKRPLYAVVFNFIDSRYFNVFATVGGNRVCYRKKPLLFFWFIFILLSVFLSF